MDSIWLSYTPLHFFYVVMRDYLFLLILRCSVPTLYVWKRSEISLVRYKNSRSLQFLSYLLGLLFFFRHFLYCTVFSLVQNEEEEEEAKNICATDHKHTHTHKLYDVWNFRQPINITRTVKLRLPMSFEICSVLHSFCGYCCCCFDYVALSIRFISVQFGSFRIWYSVYFFLCLPFNSIDTKTFDRENYFELQNTWKSDCCNNRSS